MTAATRADRCPRACCAPPIVWRVAMAYGAVAHVRHAIARTQDVRAAGARPFPGGTRCRAATDARRGASAGRVERSEARPVPVRVRVLRTLPHTVPHHGHSRILESGPLLGAARAVDEPVDRDAHLRARQTGSDSP